jgi:hypothetical protein
MSFEEWTNSRCGGRRVEGICARLLPRKVQDLHRVSVMAEVTYYVALPFIGTDDGIAAGEPTVYASIPTRPVIRAEAFLKGRVINQSS